jgi:hypothetical protein
LIGGIAVSGGEKYGGTSLSAIRAAMEAMHTLNREHLAHWGEPDHASPNP